MAKKRTTTEKEDARRGSARFIDQKGQWKSTTPASVKKRQAKAWADLEASMKKKKK